ncbi:hypothetical protein SASPL_131115 [Salvia splendens]|uniref:Uncharacterized protein n=1 Tax=Salvia splendens TaxID=180675 RepID=A0A8X8X860_SALSN|nr:hypothetical protein SASPL_131115 [Salvia splendens]
MMHGEYGVASSEIDKPKLVLRKVSSQTEVAQKQSQSELERVKRNLRKVSTSAVTAPRRPGPETEKPHPLHSVEIVAFPTPDISEQEMDEPIEVEHDNYPVAETPSLENGVKMESIPSLDAESSSKEEQNRKEILNLVFAIV